VDALLGRIDATAPEISENVRTRENRLDGERFGEFLRNLVLCDDGNCERAYRNGCEATGSFGGDCISLVPPGEEVVWACFSCSADNDPARELGDDPAVIRNVIGKGIEETGEDIDTPLVDFSYECQKACDPASGEGVYYPTVVEAGWNDLAESLRGLLPGKCLAEFEQACRWADVELSEGKAQPDDGKVETVETTVVGLSDPRTKTGAGTCW
jgi:hypothetical protein